MNPVLTPASALEAVKDVRANERVLAIGNGTKARLGHVDPSYVRVCTARLEGIVEYEPDEFTITALAGTRVEDVAAALSRQGQYLPFDPLFVRAGATLGGTVAAGTSGPGRFRYGGIRDFILGVRFIDGEGRLLRMGGKVVKNAAGFDVPKFMVGSLGRFGMLIEVTLKVFPRPSGTLSLRLTADSAAGAARILAEAARSHWQPDALEWSPSRGAVYLRLGGPAAALRALGAEVLNRWPGEVLAPQEADHVWGELVEVAWAYADGVLIKVPLTTAQLKSLMTGLSRIEGIRVQVSAAGNTALVSLPSANSVPSVSAVLEQQGLCGVSLRGAGPLWLGARPGGEIAERVKQALDACRRFPPLSA